MKKFFVSMFAALMCMSAFSANPDLIVNATGTEVRGLDDAVGVAPALPSTNLVQVLYPNASGWQPVADDALGTKYQKIKAQLLAKGGIEVGTNSGVVYVPTKAVSVGCQSNSSYLLFVATSSNRYDYMTNDGCAYRDKVKANAQ